MPPVLLPGRWPTPERLRGQRILLNRPVIIGSYVFDLLGDQPCFSVKFLLHLSILFRPRCESGYGGGGGYCTHVQYVYSTFPQTKQLNQKIAQFYHTCILYTHIVDLYLSFLPQQTLCNEERNNDSDDHMSGSNVLQLSLPLPLKYLGTSLLFRFVQFSSHFQSQLNTK